MKFLSYAIAIGLIIVGAFAGAGEISAKDDDGFLQALRAREIPAHDAADHPPLTLGERRVSALVFITCHAPCMTGKPSDAEIQEALPWGVFLEAPWQLQRPSEKPGYDSHVQGTHRYLAGFVFADVEPYFAENPMFAPQIYLLSE